MFVFMLNSPVNDVCIVQLFYTLMYSLIRCEDKTVCFISKYPFTIVCDTLKNSYDKLISLLCTHCIVSQTCYK